MRLANKIGKFKTFSDVMKYVNINKYDKFSWTKDNMLYVGETFVNSSEMLINGFIRY